ncbi:peptide ABC transporter substrate-binding protein [Ktedonosporobacter rubrisoli]|uniref:Peptide ABC transporter substrate-binding protein n=1 Tax=Ktedonosporobacter rubrisoli TaxID=2509675 RepID=A0A4V0YYM8_KTERU|nr:peptide ABC transporter substrate-binding protein [Ktedonosporobacter rubrisoli]QBD76771.1 peptide ABC transporter substrate-binding protein [Ktedonosporobacter rubrisoli]
MQRHTISRMLLLSSLLCLFALLVTACASGAPQSSSNNSTKALADKQIFRYPIGSSDFGTLDPALASLNIDINAIEMVFTGLVAIKGDGSVVDQMAASHSISSDGLTYTFTLKPNLKFSDGTPLTAHDIVWSINRALSPATKSPTASYLEPIKDWEKMVTGKINTLIGDSLIAKDDNTVVIVLGHPAAYFLTPFAIVTALTVNKKLLDKYGNTWTDHLQEGAGAGPFMVQSYDHNKGLSLVPNPNYYGPKPKLQKVELLRSGDINTTYKTYQTGQLDYAAVPTVQLASAEKRNDYHSSPALAIVFIAMNYLAKPFDNIKIRQALALAVNKDLIAQNVLHGSVIPTNHLMPEGVPGYDKNLTGPAGVASTKGDQEKAKQLLQEGMKEAGYSSISQLPLLKLAYFGDDSDFTNVVAVLAQQWQSVLGITVQTNAQNSDVIVQQIMNTTGNPGPLQMWQSEIGNYADPQGWLSFNFAKGAAFNTMNYGQNKSSDAAAQQAVQDELQKADVNLDPQARMRQYNEAEQKLVNDVGWLPLYQAATQALINPKLQNFTLQPLDVVAPDDWSNIYFVK